MNWIKFSDELPLPDKSIEIRKMGEILSTKTSEINGVLHIDFNDGNPFFKSGSVNLLDKEKTEWRYLPYVKYYTAIRIIPKKDDEDSIFKTLIPSLSFGETTGSPYNIKYPETLHETEEKAIEHARNHDEYSEWLILPVIKFQK